jgi:hypothetical protein
MNELGYQFAIYLMTICKASTISSHCAGHFGSAHEIRSPPCMPEMLDQRSIRRPHPFISVWVVVTAISEAALQASCFSLVVITSSRHDASDISENVASRKK